MAKLLTIFGVTGHLGGSLVDPAIKAGFKVRGVTREAGDKSKPLEGKGVEIVESDMVRASVSDLTRVLEGSHAAMLMTNYWDPEMRNKEMEIGKKLVDAAKNAGVKHVLWLTLDDATKISRGKYDVPDFTDKAKVTEYIESLQAKRTFASVTYVMPAFFFQNLKTFGMMKKDGDEWVMTIPETRFLTACDVNEMGHAIVAALQDPKRFDGKRIEYWGEHAHPQTFVDTFKRVTGEKARLNMLPIDKFNKTMPLGQDMGKEFGNMFGWFNDYSLYGPMGQPFSETSGQRNTPGGLSNFSTYLTKHGWN